MDVTAVSITLGSAITIALFLIAISNFFGGKKKNDKEDEARLVRIEATLIRIEQNTSDLKTRVDCYDKRLDEHGNRITVVETKLKSQHRGGR